ncbi:MAG: DUF4815 domain-containing protein, partial [Erysipelotrichaceae bacterium]
MDTSNAPFHDDYDAKKGFHKILFRPRIVQARELNQMQSIQQEQISRMCSHFFKSGSVVGEGSISIKERQDVIKFVFPTSFDAKYLENKELNLSVKSSDSGLRAKLLSYQPIDGNTGWGAIEYLNTDGE